jgi:NAD(P)H-hydrate epimerase
MPGHPLKGIIKPHHNEFKCINGTGTTDDLPENTAMVGAYPEKMGLVTVLKGPVDVISGGSRVMFSRTGNPGMTVTGTGDVLAGTIGALY